MIIFLGGIIFGIGVCRIGWIDSPQGIVNYLVLNFSGSQRQRILLVRHSI